MTKTIEQALAALTVARAESNIANRKAMAARLAADTLGRIAVTAGEKVVTAQTDLDEAIDARLRADGKIEAPVDIFSRRGS